MSNEEDDGRRQELSKMRCSWSYDDHELIIMSRCSQSLRSSLPVPYVA